ncbi:MAG: hypothetical protein EZS28_031881 [Streblomastix strix]|uniref:Uncharacterized protein n=1 Tax=Streblomastix strix TaxID=222440 RepID=A0A5J4URB1_9EUKA|nr:MAG: hypothetical protein EZS28_031881 [Streblomastix strix]
MQSSNLVVQNLRLCDQIRPKIYCERIPPCLQLDKPHDKKCNSCIGGDFRAGPATASVSEISRSLANTIVSFSFASLPSANGQFGIPTNRDGKHIGAQSPSGPFGNLKIKGLSKSLRRRCTTKICIRIRLNISNSIIYAHKYFTTKMELVPDVFCTLFDTMRENVHNQLEEGDLVREDKEDVEASLENSKNILINKKQNNLKKR